MTRPSPLPESSRFLPLIAFVLSIAALYYAREVLIPFALAVLFGFLLAPVVKGLERCRLGRVPAVGIVFLVGLFAAAGIGWVVSDQLIDVVSQLPSYQENIHNKIAALQGPSGGALRKAADSFRELSAEISVAPVPAEPSSAQAGAHSTGTGSKRGLPAASTRPVPVELIERPTGPLQYLANLLGPVAGPLGTASVVAVFTIFVLMKREDLRNRLIRLVAHGQLNTMTQVLDDAAQRVSRYLLVEFCLNSLCLNSKNVWT